MEVGACNPRNIGCCKRCGGPMHNRICYHCRPEERPPHKRVRRNRGHREPCGQCIRCIVGGLGPCRGGK